MQKTNYSLEEAYNKACEFEATEQIIGIQKEKILHKTLKYYLCNDESKHEVKIKKSSKGILYADICIDNNIYEIQTRGLNKLRDKLDEFLNDYDVTVVHPIAYKKNIYKIEETGEVIGPKKSPKTGKVFDAFKELYKIKFYLNNPKLHLKIVLLDIDEYRNVVTKKHARSSGYIREKQIPKKIYKIIDIYNKEDYIHILEELSLPKTFTSNDFRKAVKINKTLVSYVMNILTYVEAVKRIGKDGNSYIYEIAK